MLRVNIQKSFGAFQLKIAFEHSTGVLVMFGRSGTGKTTTLRCIAGLESPDNGSISLNDHLLFDRSKRTAIPPHRRRVGLLFQTPTLFPHMTARQNIAFAAKHADRAFEIDKWLDRMDVSNVANRRPATMSGGEQQRVSLIRAIAAKPKLLLLDEPMSAVDVPTRRSLVKHLRNLQSETGIPMIYVTHSATEAMQVGDRMVMIDDGRIIADGVPKELLHAPETVPLAGLTGNENVLTGLVEEHDASDHTSVLRIGTLRLNVPYLSRSVGQQASVAFRPEDVLAASNAISGTSARNQFPGQVTRIETGPMLYLHVRLKQNEITGNDKTVQHEIVVRVRVTQKSIDALNLHVGSIIHLLIKAWSIYLVEETSR